MSKKKRKMWDYHGEKFLSEPVRKGNVGLERLCIGKGGWKRWEKKKGGNIWGG